MENLYSRVTMSIVQPEEELQKSIKKNKNSGDRSDSEDDDALSI